jgi:hypothetical protein
MDRFYAYHYNHSLNKEITRLQRAILKALPGKKGRKLSDRIADVSEGMEYKERAK